MEERVLLFGPEVFRGLKFLNVDAVQRPAVRRRIGPQLIRRLRQRDVHAGFAAPDAFEKKLEAKGGFSGAGVSFDKMGSIGGQSAAQQVVEPRDPCRDFLGGCGR